jgi:4-hydroxybenzoate polyprenyltransferase
MSSILPYVQLTRPANIITAIADILAGFAISGAAIILLDQENAGYTTAQAVTLCWLLLSTIGLYAGGIVFNDVFDAALDKKERPERPIPSAKVSLANAAILGASLLILGILAAYQASTISALIAFVIAALAINYDAFGKHYTFIGPLNMGLCRGCNLLLGISAVTTSLAEYWFIAIVPILYIAAVTAISRGEVHGGNALLLKIAVYLYLAVILLVLAISYFTAPFPVWQILPFLLLFAYMIYPPLFTAIHFKQAKFIGLAVKAGVISLIILNAAVSVAFAGFAYGILVLLLLPVSTMLANKFAVT